MFHGMLGAPLRPIEELSSSISAVQYLKETAPSVFLPLFYILKKLFSSDAFSSLQNTSELFTPLGDVFWASVLRPITLSTSNALNSGIWGGLCLMASFWNGSESAWVFQVPFPLGTINLFISWKAGLCTFVFDVTLEADKYECWKAPKSWNGKKSKPLWQSRFKYSWCLIPARAVAIISFSCTMQAHGTDLSSDWARKRFSKIPTLYLMTSGNGKSSTSLHGLFT